MESTKAESDTSDTRNTNEKPVSLHPLEFKKALKALLSTKPLTAKKSEGESKNRGTKPKSPLTQCGALLICL